MAALKRVTCASIRAAGPRARPHTFVRERVCCVYSCVPARRVRMCVAVLTIVARMCACGAGACVWFGVGMCVGGGGGGNEGLKWAGAAQCVRVHVHAVWRVRISDERNVR